ncbi:MAG: hypothetical protein HY240_09105 [Actinobacteria bacterium]|nr:hypothetical protein [Actinomycetota bacterium]
MRRLAVAILVATLLPLLIESPALAAAGDLDATFGSSGTVTTSVGSGDDVLVAVTVQPSDQAIVAVGYTATGSGDDWLIMRYNPNGTLDATFGSGGIVTTSFGSGTDHAHAVAIDANGKIVVAGYSDNITSHDFSIARYTSSGALDGTFGSGGTTTTSLGTGDDEINGMAIDANGKIVVAGQTVVSLKNEFALARYTTSGSLDTTFGSSGSVKTDVGAGSDAANAVAIQGNGKIVAAGRSNNGTDRDFALVRYTTDGSIDTSYGTGGIQTTAIGPADDEIQAIALDGSGDVVAAGYSDSGVDLDFALARYDTSGSLDGTFGSGGTTTTNIGHNDTAYGVAIQGDGMIVVSGTAGSSYFGVARYTTGGVLDGGFGTGGVVYTQISPFGNNGFGTALQADGSIVVVGDAYGTRYDAAAARYLVAPPVPYYQPDGAIRLGKGKYVGDNAYNTTAAKQTVTAKALRGSKKTFTVRVENDGNSTDTFTVKGKGAQTGFAVKYFQGTTDVTSSVVAGTFTTSSIASGGSITLKLVITVKKTAKVGVTRSWLVSATSVTDATKKDAVKAKVRVKG